MNSEPEPHAERRAASDPVCIQGRFRRDHCTRGDRDGGQVIATLKCEGEPLPDSYPGRNPAMAHFQESLKAKRLVFQAATKEMLSIDVL